MNWNWGLLYFIAYNNYEHKGLSTMKKLNGCGMDVLIDIEVEKAGNAHKFFELYQNNLTVMGG